MFYDHLKSFYIFQGIEKSSIDKINEMPILRKRYSEGELVNEMGDRIKYIHLILQGSLKTNEYSIDGNELVSSYYFANDTFPFYLVYGEEYYYPYNVYCHKDALVYHIPVNPLMDTISSDIKFMQNILTFVAKYTCYNKRVIRTVRRTKVSERIAEWVLESTHGEKTFIMPGTQEVFAKMLLVNRSVLNQELKKLESLGVLKLEGRKIHILNKKYLHDLLEH